MVITLGPTLTSLYPAFTTYNLPQTPTFTGLANIQRMLGDERLGKSLAVTFGYVIISVPLQFAAALLLDRGLRGLPFYRSVLYLPSLLGGAVAVAVLWRLVFSADELFNAFLALFGVDEPSWVSSPNTALGTIELLHVWTFGAPMVIFLAGLRQVPRELYEAASTDGASPIRKFTAITLPMLSPITFFNLEHNLVDRRREAQLIRAVRQAEHGLTAALAGLTIMLSHPAAPATLETKSTDGTASPRAALLVRSSTELPERTRLMDVADPTARCVIDPSNSSVIRFTRNGTKLWETALSHSSTERAVRVVILRCSPLAVSLACAV